MNKKVVIIEAISESLDLPGLLLKSIFSRPVIKIVTDQIKRSSRVDDIVVLTSESTADQELADYCAAEGVQVHRSSADNLLESYHDTARQFLADTVIRVQGNSPLLEPTLIDAMLGSFNRKADYYSNCQPVRTVPLGQDIEIFSSAILEEMKDEVRDKDQQQAVTSYLYEQPDLFKLQSFELYSQLAELDFSIKNIDDFVFISKVCGQIGEGKFLAGDFDIIQAVEAYNQVVLSQS